MGARGAPGTRGFRRRRGHLTRRTVAVSVLLSAIIGSAFFLLMLAIEGLRDSEGRANHSLEVLISASRLERLVIDVETSQRGFIITGDPRFLRPWYEARAASAQEVADLEHLASAGDAGESTRARRITQAAGSYIKDYAVPLVTAAQRDLGSARTVVPSGYCRGNRQRRGLDRPHPALRRLPGPVGCPAGTPGVRDGRPRGRRGSHRSDARDRTW